MVDVIIEADGTIRFIHHDALSGLLEHGEAKIVRASNVEPTEDARWTADMGPSSGPVLGPFKTRGEALAAEVQWLKDNRGL
jgi:hypothetical protein